MGHSEGKILIIDTVSQNKHIKLENNEICKFKKKCSRGDNSETKF